MLKKNSYIVKKGKLVNYILTGLVSETPTPALNSFRLDMTHIFTPQMSSQIFSQSPSHRLDTKGLLMH